jgi:hypothetical protein
MQIHIDKFIWWGWPGAYPEARWVLVVPPVRCKAYYTKLFVDITYVSIDINKIKLFGTTSTYNYGRVPSRQPLHRLHRGRVRNHGHANPFSMVTKLALKHVCRCKLTRSPGLINVDYAHRDLLPFKRASVWQCFELGNKANMSTTTSRLLRSLM